MATVHITPVGNRPHLRALVILLGLAGLLLFSGCRKDDGLPDNLWVPRLMLETRGVNYGALTGEVATLPVSGTSIPLAKDPVVTEFQIVNAEMVEVDMGMALLLQTNEAGARELYRGTVTHMGGRIVLLINGNAVGARRIDGPIEDGNFYTFVEMDDEALGQLVLDLKESIVYLQESR